MSNINYKSDFKIFEEGCDFTVPFLFEYRTVFDRQYVASHVDGIYTNCQLQEDGRLLVVFDDHNLPPGILTCTRHFYLSDQDFHDGICDLWDKRDTGIILTTNRTDCCEVSIELPPFYMQGEPGTTPHIGENGNWYIGDEDTGVLAKGKDGSNGKTPVFASGTVTTLQPNTSATGSVESDGVSEDGSPKYKINLGIPRGEKGESGTDGTNGADGKTPIFESGTATSVDSSAQPSIDITSNGTDTSGNPKYLVNVSIPKGEKGDTGEQGPQGEKGETGSSGTDGEDGKTPVLEIGQTSTLDPGSSATASLIPDGTDLQGNPKYKLNLGIPQGEKGEEGSVTGGLSELSDVDITSLQDDQILISSSGKWINANLSDYISVEWGDISNIPDTLEGYGITGDMIINALFSVDGSGSGLDADTVDGQHNGNLTANRFNILGESTNLNTQPGFGFFYWGENAVGRPLNHNYGVFLQFANANDPVPGTNQQWINQLAYDTNNRIHIRQNVNSQGFTNWKTLACLTDNVASADKWNTAINITLTGDVSGSASIDGSDNVTINTSISNLENIDADTLDGYHANGLFTSVTSSSSTDLSITIGGVTKTVPTLYATYAYRLENSRTIFGQSFNGLSNVSGAMSGVTTIEMDGNLSGVYNIIPGSHNTYTLGTSSMRFNNIYSTAGNFSSNVNAYQFAATGDSILKRSGFTYESILDYSWESSKSDFIALRIPGNSNHEATRIEIQAGGAGGLQVYGNIRYTGTSSGSSDMRLKEKLTDIDLKVADIANAPFFKFKWKGKKEINIGSSAQYWMSFLPEAVHKDANGYLSMEYANIALLSAISLSREICNIMNRLDNIEKVMRV